MVLNDCLTHRLICTMRMWTPISDDQKDHLHGILLRFSQQVIPLVQGALFVRVVWKKGSWGIILRIFSIYYIGIVGINLCLSRISQVWKPSFTKSDPLRFRCPAVREAGPQLPGSAGCLLRPEFMANNNRSRWNKEHPNLLGSKPFLTMNLWWFSPHCCYQWFG